MHIMRDIIYIYSQKGDKITAHRLTDARKSA